MWEGAPAVFLISQDLRSQILPMDQESFEFLRKHLFNKAPRLPTIKNETFGDHLASPSASRSECVLLAAFW